MTLRQFAALSTLVITALLCACSNACLAAEMSMLPVTGRVRDASPAYSKQLRISSNIVFLQSKVSTYLIARLPQTSATCPSMAVTNSTSNGTLCLSSAKSSLKPTCSLSMASASISLRHSASVFCTPREQSLIHTAHLDHVEFLQIH